MGCLSLYQGQTQSAPNHEKHGEHRMNKEVRGNLEIYCVTDSTITSYPQYHQFMGKVNYQQEPRSQKRNYLSTIVGEQ